MAAAGWTVSVERGSQMKSGVKRMKSRHRKGDAGFFLLELLVLAGILMASASALAIYHQSAALERENMLRVAAVYLAKQELAELAALSREGRLAPGAYGWLGEEAPVREGVEFAVEAEVRVTEGPDGWRADVVVSWPGHTGGGTASLQLEREWYEHETTG